MSNFDRNLALVPRMAAGDVSSARMVCAVKSPVAYYSFFAAAAAWCLHVITEEGDRRSRACLPMLIPDAVLMQMGEMCLCAAQHVRPVK